MNINSLEEEVEGQLEASAHIEYYEEENAEEIPDDEEIEEETFDCKYCEFQTTDIEELDEHLIEHEEALVEYDDGSAVSEVQQLPAFYEEFKNKPIKNIFACPFCGYQSMKKHDMNRHINNHKPPTESPIYGCSECPYTTLRKFDMPKHLLTHCNNFPKFKCTECSYETKRKSDLNKHKVCHNIKSTKLPSFPCPICHYGAKRHADLKKHLITHEVGKSAQTYNCTECGYTSKRISDLHKHVILHSDKNIEGILKCPKCNYATKTTSPFAWHILSQCRSNDMAEEYMVVTEEIVEENVRSPRSLRKRKLPEQYEEYYVEDDESSENKKLSQDYEEYCIEDEVEEAVNNVEIFEEIEDSDRVVILTEYENDSQEGDQ